MPVCDRTPQVRDAILTALSLTDCSAVTDVQLQSIRDLDLGGQNLTSLRSGDFLDMTGLLTLTLDDNALTTLPEDIFRGLSSLVWLLLQNNELSVLPAPVFQGLDRLQHLRLTGNRLTSLSVELFRHLGELRELSLARNPLTTESFPPGIFAGLSSLVDVFTRPTERAETTIVFPLAIEEVSRSGAEIRLRLVIPQGAPGPLQIRLRTTGRAESSESVVTINSGETHSEEFALTLTGHGWQFSATWDWKTRYPHVLVSFPTGFEIATAALDSPAGARNLRDRADDISGPQIHVVYATRVGDEDRELDRNGSIETSLEIIQEWLESEIGRTLRLDTYDGALDVTYLQVDDADIDVRNRPPCANCGPGLRGADYLTYIRSVFPESPSKTYAVFLDIHEAGNLSGLGSEELGIGVTFLKTRTPAAGAQKIGSVERTMLHEIVHALGGVGDCAPNSTARIEELQRGCGSTGHVTDDINDLMGVEVDIEERSVTYYGGTTLDADRNDYVGHGRPGCFDLLTSPFLE